MPQFGYNPSIGSDIIGAYGERTVFGYLDGIVNPPNTIQVYRAGGVVAQIPEDRPATALELSLIAASDRLAVTGGKQVIRFSSAGASQAITTLARACGITLQPIDESSSANRGNKSPGRSNANQPALVMPARPLPIASDIPPEFAAGTLILKTQGGCTRFYDQNGRFAIAEAVNRNDWNEAVRRVIDHGCSTDIAWYVLGISSEKFGMMELAKRYFNKALESYYQNSISNIYSNCSSVGRENSCLGIKVLQESSIEAMRLSYASLKIPAGRYLPSRDIMIGKWSYAGDCASEFTVTYNPDGTLKDLWQVGTWRLDGSTISFLMSGEERIGKRPKRYGTPRSGTNTIQMIDRDHALLGATDATVGIVRCQ